MPITNRDIAQFMLGRLAWAAGKWGRRFVECLGLIVDCMEEAAVLGAMAVWTRNPEQPEDARLKLAEERRMPRYPGETDRHHWARLADWRSFYEDAGSTAAVVEELEAFGFTGAVIMTPGYTRERTAGDLGVTGTPAATETTAHYRVEITGAGAVGVAAFRWSRDGGDTWEATGQVTSNHFALGSTGLYLDFPDAGMTTAHYWTFTAYYALLPADWPSQFWIVVPAGGHSYGPPTACGDAGAVCGTMRCGISGVTSEQVEGVHALIRRRKPSNWVCREISFEFASGEPSRIGIEVYHGT